MLSLITNDAMNVVRCFQQGLRKGFIDLETDMAGVTAAGPALFSCIIANNSFIRRKRLIALQTSYATLNAIVNLRVILGYTDYMPKIRRLYRI